MSVTPALHRLQLLTGTSAIEKLAQTRVIVFGIGGVGSWCAEALVRSGVGTVAIVDSDEVCVTNINRQVQAAAQNVGKAKTAELGRRLREIMPSANILEKQMVFDATTAASFDLGSYHYIIDAIDSLSSKVELIIRASESGATVYAALGASGKIDPTRITVSSLWDSHDCRFGKLVRKRLRRRKFDGAVTCVYSPEEAVLHPGEAHEGCGSKKQINGSAVHVTGTFGFFLAGLVVQDVVRQAALSNQVQENSH